MIGKTISHYKILEKLGEGGMGVVYKAEDTKLGRFVALKFLPKGLEADEAERARFIQEAKAASALNHPNVCIIYDLQEHEDEQFIVMEYVDGVTLREKIREGLKEGESTGHGTGSPMPMKDVLSYAIQIGEALQEAHSKGIIHRDIKSDNIMVMAKGQVKVMDFGLAKLKGALRLTKSTSTVGTLAYMAPEQLQGKETDARMDIFSFGVILYEMLTGQMPFKGEYESAIMYSILNTDPESLSDMPVNIDSIVYKALEKNPDERYQCADDLLKDLKKAQKEVEFMSSKERIADEKPKPSIAVLPFVNMSADSEQEYFCDGIAEEIINVLTHIEGLRVIARTSAFSFKGKDIDISEIGKKLKVENILEGSVRKSGSRLRITAQLINVSDSSHLWSERYDRQMEDVFDIQDEISLAIVDNLKVKLLGKEKAAIVKRYTEEMEAYNLYLKGNYYWQMLTKEGYDKAIECYEQTLKKDPNYALAYTGLSMVHCVSTYWGNVPPNEAYPRAKECVKKALEIDDTLAEAHASLGLINMHYDWNWKEAEREFKQALQLNPNHALTHLHYAILLTFTERHKEAITETIRGQDLDPLSAYYYSVAGNAIVFTGRYDEAIEELQMAITMHPNYFHLHFTLGGAYMGKSMIAEAIAEWEKAVELSGGASHIMGRLATAYYESGEVDKAEKIFDVVKQRSKDEYVPPMCFYCWHKVRGEHDQAFEWLERACDEHDSFLPWFRVYPVDKYRIPDEPRYKALMKKAGLEE